MRERRLLLAGLAGSVLLPQAAFAQEDHLEGAHLRVVISSFVGSGNDAVGRVFARHAQRLLPRTELTVENVGGAAGRVAEKMIWESGPDGLTIGMMRPSMTFRVLLDPEGHPYDFGDFTWLGSISRDRWVLVSRADGPLDSLEALKALDRPAVAAVDNVDSTRFKYATLLNLLLGTRILPVPGYKTSDARLALISGESDLLLSNYTTIAALIEGGEARVLLKFADQELPGASGSVPSLASLPVASERRWLLDLLARESALGRLVAAAPGLPAARAQRLRRLFGEVVGDPLFVAEAESLGVLVDPLVGETAQGEIEAMAAALAGRIEELGRAFDCGLAMAETGEPCPAP